MLPAIVWLASLKETVPVPALKVPLLVNEAAFCTTTVDPFAFTTPVPLFRKLEFNVIVPAELMFTVPELVSPEIRSLEPVNVRLAVELFTLIPIFDPFNAATVRVQDEARRKVRLLLFMLKEEMPVEELKLFEHVRVWFDVFVSVMSELVSVIVPLFVKLPPAILMVSDVATNIPPLFTTKSRVVKDVPEGSVRVPFTVNRF